jgi:FixJ family two-component response regulator
MIARLYVRIMAGQRDRQLTCKRWHRSGVCNSRSPMKDKGEGYILETTPIVSIVDDDEAVRFALSNLVLSLGWQTRVYESAEKFLASGEVASTACLISDIRMPGMSGIEMHELLLARGDAPPTIFISAYPTPSVQTKIAGSGAIALVEKPYSAESIQHWLSVALGPAQEN